MTTYLAIFIFLALAGMVAVICLGFWLASLMFEGEAAKFFGGCVLSLLGLILVIAIIFQGCMMSIKGI